MLKEAIHLKSTPFAPRDCSRQTKKNNKKVCCCIHKSLVILALSNPTHLFFLFPGASVTWLAVWGEKQERIHVKWRNELVPREERNRGRSKAVRFNMNCMSVLLFYRSQWSEGVWWGQMDHSNRISVDVTDDEHATKSEKQWVVFRPTKKKGNNPDTTSNPLSHTIVHTGLQEWSDYMNMDLQRHSPTTPALTFTSITTTTTTTTTSEKKRACIIGNM